MSGSDLRELDVPGLKEERKVYLDYSLAFIREKLADARHSQQLFHTSMVVYFAIFSAILTLGDKLAPAAISYIGYPVKILVVWLIVQTVFCLRCAVVATRSNSEARAVEMVLGKQVGVTLSDFYLKNPNKAVRMVRWIEYSVASVGSRISILAIMVFLDYLLGISLYK